MLFHQSSHQNLNVLHKSKANSFRFAEFLPPSPLSGTLSVLSFPSSPTNPFLLQKGEKCKIFSFLEEPLPPPRFPSVLPFPAVPVDFSRFFLFVFFPLRKVFFPYTDEKSGEVFMLSFFFRYYIQIQISILGNLLHLSNGEVSFILNIEKFFHLPALPDTTGRNACRKERSRE